MVPATADRLNEIFRLLAEQQQLLKHWPYSAEQIARDKQISARIRELTDQICADQHHPSPASSRLLRPAV